MSKNFDETLRFKCEKKKSVYERQEERLLGIAERTSSRPRTLAREEDQSGIMQMKR